MKEIQTASESDLPKQSPRVLVFADDDDDDDEAPNKKSDEDDI
jgi:hypothetical protein